MKPSQTQICCDDKENAAKGQGKARETVKDKMASGWNEKNLRTVSFTKGYSIMMVTYLLVGNSQISNILAYHCTYSQPVQMCVQLVPLV